MIVIKPYEENSCAVQKINGFIENKNFETWKKTENFSFNIVAAAYTQSCITGLESTSKLEKRIPGGFNAGAASEQNSPLADYENLSAYPPIKPVYVKLAWFMVFSGNTNFPNVCKNIARCTEGNRTKFLYEMRYLYLHFLTEAYGEMCKWQNDIISDKEATGSSELMEYLKKIVRLENVLPIICRTIPEF